MRESRKALEEPRRLLRDDPGFARLIDAVRKDGPSNVQLNAALSLANQAAKLPASRSPASVWLGRTSSQIGLAVVGLFMVGGAVSAISSSSRSSHHHEAPAALSEASAKLGIEVPAATSTPAVVAASAPAEAAVASVHVDELPSAHPEFAATNMAVASAQRSASPPSPSSIAAAPPHTTRSGTGTTDAAGATGATGMNGASNATATGSGARPTFAEELALTSEARGALKRGDIAACMNAVDRYRRTFPAGLFVQEIDVIRLEALAKSGERARAHAAAESFLAANATSPYADRVRSVLDNTE